MNNKIKVNAGDRFGRLTVIKEDKKRRRERYFVCKCDCGTISPHSLSSLRRNTRSCGCLTKEVATIRSTKHGQSRTRLYRVWCDMRKRCEDKKQPNYKDYGGRGISVCIEWQKYEAFYEWAKNNYSPGLTIDRIDNNGNYEPLNCKWATRNEQSRNTRRNVLISFNGTTICLRDWATKLGISYNGLRRRINNWSVERALTEPVGFKFKNNVS